MSGEKDQRSQLRFPLTGGEEVLGQLANRRTEAQVEVADLSLGGAGLVVPNSELLNSPKRLMLDLRATGLELGHTPIDLVHINDIRDRVTSGRIVGVRFCDHGEPFLQRLCRFLVNNYSQVAERPQFIDDPSAFSLVVDARRIRRLLVHCCRRRRQLQLFDASGYPLGIFEPRKLSKSGVTGQLDGHGRVMVPGEGCLLVFPSFIGLHVFVVSFSGGTDERATFELPLQMLEGGNRRLGRIRDVEGLQITLEFIHPQISGKFICKQVREIGLGGLRFDLAVEDDLLVRGSVVDSAVLRMPRGLTLPCRFSVRHTFRNTDGTFSCGVELIELPGQGRTIWVKQLLARMNPRVEEANRQTLSAAWDVLERSGYLDEKPGSKMAAIRQPFIDVWDRLLKGPGSNCWIYREDGEASAVLCTSQIYSNTWMVHHMAVDRAKSAGFKLIALTELLPRTAFQWLSSLHEEANVLAYFNANQSFNKGVWIKFLKLSKGRDDQDVQRLSVRDFEVDSIPSPLHEALPTVTVATRRQQAQISADLMERDGGFVHRLFDYGQLRTDRESPLGRINGSDVWWEREVLVVAEDDHLLGYALIESCESGANIFSLYDTCRIVILQDDSASHGSIRDALFYAAVKHHRAQGSRNILFMGKTGDAASPRVGTFFDVELIRALISGRTLAAWIGYLEELWSCR